eukprot:4656758-Prymnesium_polylepis.2
MLGPQHAAALVAPGGNSERRPGAKCILRETGALPSHSRAPEERAGGAPRMGLQTSRTGRRTGRHWTGRPQRAACRSAAVP